MKDKYVIGVDFGTLSGRAVVVSASDGREIANSVFEYPHAVMDTKLEASGQQLPPEWALQDPSDHIEVLKNTIPAAVKVAGIDPADVIGIATDFIACTMLPVKADGTPLSNLSAFRERPHAYVNLWKHHATQPHADRINETARQMGEPWLASYGG